MSMFCYQCEQTSQGVGCTTMGICGKSPDTAKLQDLMLYLLKGIAQYANRARELGRTNVSVNDLSLEALFMTLTNVNFDLEEHFHYIQVLQDLRESARETYVEAARAAGLAPIPLLGPAVAGIPSTKQNILAFCETLSIEDEIKRHGKDMAGLAEMLTYGIKGLAAYAHHAVKLGYRDDRIFAFVHEALSYLAEEKWTAEELVSFCLKAGAVNLQVMELLDRAHTDTFGHPEPTTVRLSPVAGKCILVSGHDMKFLFELLKQTEGTGINVYTHGELLPANAYPKLKAFPHLVGNFGGAWQNQNKEFAEFPGPIFMTTNCLKPPDESYKERLFTADVVGWQDVAKIPDYDFTRLIEKAKECPGFAQDEKQETSLIGFGHNAVLSVAGQVVEAVKTGAIRHFFLVGGCDGAEFSRNYFTDFAEKIPQDCVILTLGCGKYRFNRMEFGQIAGIPRLLDLGQCNDAYSAIKIANALAQAFNVTINELPLSLVISWFEQKAVAVLLTLLYLGIKDIRLGPNLPAFISPNVLKLLIDKYELKAVTSPAADLEAILR